MTGASHNPAGHEGATNGVVQRQKESPQPKTQVRGPNRQKVINPRENIRCERQTTITLTGTLVIRKPPKRGPLLGEGYFHAGPADKVAEVPTT